MNLVVYSLLLIVLIGIIVFLIIKNRQMETKNKELSRQFDSLEFNTNHLRLENLEAKLNPHLFKNILNSIQSHTYQAYFTIDKLSNVLNYILYETQRKKVSLKEEVEFAIDLIEINKVKLHPLFDLRIKVLIDEEDILYHKDLVAPLIFVDLIENAFKHTSFQTNDAFISILFELKNGQFALTVSNKISDKKKLEKFNSGIGLQNLEQRLKIIYGDHFKLDKFVDNTNYVATLKINLLEHKNQMLTGG